MTSLTLESFIDEMIRLSRKRGYSPTTFIQMRRRHGTVDAISRLVVSGDIQSGFRRLDALGLLDWTIEAAVRKFPDEFSREVQYAAKWRLDQVKSGSELPTRPAGPKSAPPT
ncbi:hypothetical protein [Acuticoccus mangrovi]|uniref:Uncharacterized protein n=1 Tax=Acuticoccus mangrovi TaxID=2796142 RepID=A0A934MJV8_9HYPH|nr:hypothetical protein [Acuticoccus mangrovi]MBJ3774929.1 hypothetical protein [Acuticoccus mangrovi]